MQIVMIVPVVLDGSKSFYGRIAGDHFVCKDISCLIGIESAMDFKAFGKKQWQLGWISVLRRKWRRIANWDGWQM